MDWISVKDKPHPDKNGFYRCKGYWLKSGKQHEESDIPYFGEWDIVNNFVLTHWMPLPEPPKEGSNGKH